MAYWRKRNNGYYQVCWKVKTADGAWKTMCKSLKTKNQVVAKKKFDAMFSEDEFDLKECPLFEWPDQFERVLKADDLDPKTIEKYMHHARKAVDFLSASAGRMRDIRYEHIVNFINSIKESGFSPSTVGGYKRSLKKMFGKAIKLGFMSKNPMAGIPIGKMEQRELFFSQGDIRKILEATKGNDYDNALALYFLQTGFRIQEVADSKWESINHDQRTIRVVGKYKKARTQKIPWQAYEAISKLDRSGPTIFGKQEKQLYKDVKAILQRAKVIGYPHAFRDTYGTYSIKLMGVSTLRDRMGHGSIVQTDKYSHGLNVAVEPGILALFSDWEIK
ncbi:MAG TPA: tyrosine-type recombinase/integrase [Hanamia sp.]